MIGKPYAGELQVRFDEGEQDLIPGLIPNGHDFGNDGYSQGSAYRTLRLFSTLLERRMALTQPRKTFRRRFDFVFHERWPAFRALGLYREKRANSRMILGWP
jgi:hypothetical protein